MDKHLEQEELNLLNNKGFDIPVKIMGIKKTFRCKKLSMGRLLELSEVFITMNFDEEALQSNDFQAQIASQYQSVANNAKKTAKAVSICMTDNYFVRKFLQYYIMKKYTPKDLLEFAQNLLKTADYGNFIASIALMNGNRPTKANPIEKAV
ncbi:hypothetical protein H0S70_07170 [Chryseobacterium manosquense]|uniref:Uncharacterized protein n=1 Tax=Chryseobacterium manosquense TaxID=2754694 RepID=A0A7H1DT78_9FLAO|nr:hypothetical protein [Chryseobacterium manosquense]QNS40186.1 hypothetical protein H0S70_07170 [Chryseobacterium manosquense]